MRNILIFVCVWLALLVSVNKLSPLLIENRTDYELYYDQYTMPLRATFLPWLNYDGRHFLDIAVNGSYEPVHMNVDGVPTVYPDIRRVFFPGFPFLVHLLSGFGAVNPVFVGLGLNVMLFSLSILILFRLIREQESKQTAYRSILLLLAFPTSFYFVAYYSESLFLFASVAAFYFIHKGKRSSAAIAVALATATRLIGITLLPVLAYDAWKQWSSKKKIPWVYLIAPAGSLMYMYFSWVDVGNPLAFFASAQGDAFKRDPSLLSPLLVLKDMIVHLATPSRHAGHMYRYMMEVFEFGSLALVLGIIIKGLKTLPRTYLIYMLSYVILLLFSGSASSIHRYILVLFPMYPFLADHMSERQFKIWFCTSVFFLIVLSSYFLRGYWVA